MRSLKHNKTLSFCSGEFFDGKLQPFVVGAGEVTSSLCTYILPSIASPRVFHNALHTGSHFTKEIGLHIFPTSVLQ